MTSFKLFDKQREILNYLTDRDTRYILAGGGAGGSKTFTGCYWLMQFGYYLPGAKFFIGRDSIKDTKASVLHSWRKLSKMIDFDNFWSIKDGNIVFRNGTEIEFLDLSFYPQKDPDFERLGSKEYTAGWIEEAGQVHSKAFEVLKSRIGRWKNSETIPPKMLLTCNPTKGWLFETFYRPWKKGAEDKRYKFVQALAKDNPYLPKEYIEGLKDIQDTATRERLLNGNWEYDDDPTVMIPFDVIEDMFFNDHIERGHENYIVADVARFGSDRAVIGGWSGDVLVELKVFPLSATTDIEQYIQAMRRRLRVPARNVIIDDDGVGGGVTDHISGSTPFVNNGKPFDQGYRTLKDECGYKLAEEARNIYIEVVTDMETTELIQTELGWLKTYQTDRDSKLRILPKTLIKEGLGHSPDFLDMFIMRQYPKVAKKRNPYAALKR